MDKTIDCTFDTAAGKFNFRVGVIIIKGRKILMAKNPNDSRDYYYSVGGRVKFGESIAEAVHREVLEETSIDCEPDRIVAIHENFFRDNEGIPFHEISVFYTLKPNEKLAAIENGHTTDHGPNGEYLEWVDMDSSADIAVYPAFFRTMDFENETDVRHFIDIDI